MIAKSNMPGEGAVSSRLQGTPDETLSRHPAAYSTPGNDKNSLETVVYSCVAINNTLFPESGF
ncbi:hypothetical protein HTS61_15405 [Escherichia coli]|nr:hypothetical protein [Escherichia coli]